MQEQRTVPADTFEQDTWDYLLTPIVMNERTATSGRWAVCVDSIVLQEVFKKMHSERGTAACASAGTGDRFSSMKRL